MTGGKDANTSGSLFERQTALALSAWFEVGDPVQYTEWVKQGEPTDRLVQHFPYESIYGSSRTKSEYCLVLPDGFRIRFECKWQNVGGSVDEKFPYVLENALKVPEKMVCIAVGGPGFREAAVDWLATHAPRRAREVEKEILVFRGQDQLNAWAQDNGQALKERHGDQSGGKGLS